MRAALAGPLLAASCLLAQGCGKPPSPDPGDPKANAASEPTASEPAASKAAASEPAASEAAASEQAQLQVVERRALGTVVSLQAFVPAEATLPQPARRTFDEAFDELRSVEQQMSTWIATSDVAQVNEHAFQRPVAVGPATFAVLERSLWASALSEGAFDITFEVMHGLWRFDHDADGRIPPASAVAERRQHIDFRAVSLDASLRQVRLLRPATRINLGGIAKGYALDRMAGALRRGGLRSFLVQAGGDLYAGGKKPDGSPWLVGVRDPRGPRDSFFGTLAVEEHAFSTAGDYERAFVRDGVRYHHIVDPRTGYPAQASRSVSVWARDAFTADALDDALFVLGPERGLPLCEQVEGCGAVVVDAGNRVWVSSRLRGAFRQHRAPTDGP